MAMVMQKLLLPINCCGTILARANGKTAELTNWEVNVCRLEKYFKAGDNEYWCIYKSPSFAG